MSDAKFKVPAEAVPIEIAERVKAAGLTLSIDSDVRNKGIAVRFTGRFTCQSQVDYRDILDSGSVKTRNIMLAASEKALSNAEKIVAFIKSLESTSV